MPFVPIILVVAVMVGGAILLPKALAAFSRQATLNECRRLQAELDAIRVQGGDQIRAIQIETQLRRCVSEANAQGLNIDPAEARLGSCETFGVLIATEWTHYKSTSMEDAIKRNNTRASILRAGEDMVACLRAVVTEATSLSTLDRAEAFVREQIFRSSERVMCFLNGAPGCSRYGLNEAHVSDKASDEMLRIGAPLGIIEVYGISWRGSAGDGLAIPGGADALTTIDSTSVLRAIRQKRAELTPMQSALPGASGSAISDIVVRF